MRNLVSKDLSVGVVKLDDVLDRSWRLCYQRALSQQIANLSKVMLLGKQVDVLEELVFGNASQRILDPESISKGSDPVSAIRTPQ